MPKPDNIRHRHFTCPSKWTRVNLCQHTTVVYILKFRPETCMYGMLICKRTIELRYPNM